MLTGFRRRWRHRLDFLRRETAYQARGVASLLAALAFAPAADAPVLVLVAAPPHARLLRRLVPLAARARCDVRVVKDEAELEAALAAAAARQQRLLLANELYARFHARLAADVLAGRLAVA
jgi:hypothetical protein